MPRRLPYGTWPSPISAAMVTAGQKGLGHVQIEGGRLYWCESLPEEAGRTRLMRRDPDGHQHEVTAGDVNLRTRIQEYGGSAYLACGHGTIGVSDADQRLWLLEAQGAPVPLALTADRGGRLMFGDLSADPSRPRIVAVREDHRASGEPRASIVAVALDGSTPEGVVLADGHDFFACPRVSPDGTKLAWLCWDHPDMPWDRTALFVAPIGPDGMPGKAERIAGQNGEAIPQIEWLDDRRLVFATDRAGFWNLALHDTGADARDAQRLLQEAETEFAGPLWQLGTRWFVRLGPDRLAVRFVERGFWKLGVLDVPGGALTRLDLPFVDMASLAADLETGTIAFVGQKAAAPAEVALLRPADGVLQTVTVAGSLPVDAAFVSRARPVTFETADQRTGHAFYYPPTHPDFEGEANEAPPMIVRSHGGPTGSASPALRLAYQFWTSRGFAILDVDYRGSTGYGRAYREALTGAWGVADVEDCVAAAQAQIDAGRADPDRLIIAGSSAGGFTTLAALTFTDRFRAGASYYGIGDLEALLSETHKFESRYLDRLVGPWPAAADLYRARSPIHHVDRLACPVIFFQGQDDKVVPPSQAERMVEAIRNAGLPVAYHAFEGEGHGFRNAATVQAALNAEYAFYAEIFGFEPGRVVTAPG